MVGVGGFGGQRRAWMRRSGLYEIVALHDWDENAAMSAAAEEGAVCVKTMKDLLAFPGLEAVVISTGAKYHCEQCLLALEAGLPVFVEKPLCSTPAELLELLRAVQQAGLPFVVGHMELSTDPYVRRTRELIDSGVLGKICAFEKTTAHSGAFAIKPGDWRADPAKNPGGMLFQCGVHALHELMYYFGPVTEVFAQMRYDLMPTQTADAALCNLRFASGLVGTLNAYHCTPYRHTLSIYGLEASLYRDERHGDEGTRFHLQRRSPEGSYEPHEVLEPLGESDPTGSLQNFYQAVRQQNPALCYPGIFEGARAVAVTFAAEESSRTGGPVALDKYLPDSLLLSAERKEIFSAQ
jgi:predicted dehydrogenase